MAMHIRREQGTQGRAVSAVPGDPGGCANQCRRAIMETGCNGVRPFAMNRSTGDRTRSRRSFIFMPGLRPDMFPKAVASGADIVCADLEDAVHPDDKASARQKTLALMASGPDAGEAEVVVRINSVRTPAGLLDLAAVVEADRRGPPSLMLPKVAAGPRRWP